MIQKIFIQPGGWFFGGGQLQVETLLGSCVTFTCWQAQLKVGGLCHFMLPNRQRNPHQSLDGRYGEEAFLWLKQQVQRNGLDINECETKLFGGSRALVGTSAHSGVGLRNISFARDYLRKEGIALTSFDLGGQGHRYLRFDLSSGDVWIRQGAPLAFGIQGVGKAL